MISKTTKNTILFNEMDKENQNYWFSFTDKKFISHVDTFYFVVYPNIPDWCIDSLFLEVQTFLNQLKDYKKIVEKNKEQLEIFKDVVSDVYMSPFKVFKMYKYNLCVKDCFDIFISDYLPNSKTPPIVVQLCSNSLWLDGMYTAFEKACDVLDKILGKYNIKVSEIKENRIDYCFHTNYTQDIANFFPEKQRGVMQVSNFRSGDTHFYLHDEQSYIDYFTLGRRKSNNVFFRVYDKTKEVIEMGYKHFFFKIWLHEGLINNFDFWILDKCARMGKNWNNIDKCRAEFYLCYGNDKELKDKIISLNSNHNTPISSYTKLIRGVVPRLTSIVNIEFQVKRKFFDRLNSEYNGIDEFNHVLHLLHDFKFNTYRDYIYNFLGQSKSVVNFLTNNTIRFVKYKGKYATVSRFQRPVATWWNLLRCCNFFEISSIEAEYCREYQLSIDMDLMIKTLVSKMAVYSAYFSFRKDNSFQPEEVFSDVLMHINDNDLYCNLMELYNFKSYKKRRELRKMYGLSLE